MTGFSFPTPAGFDLRTTVFSHGWCLLEPFRVEQDPFVLERIMRVSHGGNLRCRVTESEQPTALNVTVTGPHLSKRVQQEIGRQLEDMLFFDCDLTAFYRMVRKHPEHRWMARRRAGRFLRGATFFEDVVKTILTTNCSWSLTESMNRNLVALFGDGSATGPRSFPLPDAIADTTERRLREEARLGYRAPYILEFARRCARGDLDIESFRSAHAPASALYKELRAIKGIGDYAAGNLLRLLGRFEYLGLDSWCRTTYSAVHGNNAPVRDQDIEAHYAQFESWKGLVMWLDLTRHWYTQKFPLQED